MTTTPTLSTLKVLQEGLELLGPNGEHWVKQAYEHSGNYCALGAIAKAAYGYVYQDTRHPRPPDRFKTALYKSARTYLTKALFDSQGTSIVMFNDHPETTFDHVRQLFERAIELAENDERS